MGQKLTFMIASKYFYDVKINS